MIVQQSEIALGVFSGERRLPAAHIRMGDDDGKLPALRAVWKAGCLPLQGGSRRSPDIRDHRLPAFTIIELLIVMSIIIVLAGLLLATSSYVQKKGARSRAEAEIAAMSAALENYKADNGTYPTAATVTDNVDPANTPFPTRASQFLYGELTGDRDFDGVTDTNGKSYIPFKPQSLQRANMSQPIGAGNAVTAIRDPFGNSYGYSTAKASQPTGTVGYNPTFDLWSTAGTTSASASDRTQWIKNW